MSEIMKGDPSMLEKELAKLVKSLLKFHVWLLRLAIGDFALGLKVLAIVALGTSFYFLIAYGTPPVHLVFLFDLRRWVFLGNDNWRR